MHQINIPDQLFADLQQRALLDGFSTVDEYVIDVFAQDFPDSQPNLDHLFTPERMALVQESIDSIDAGKGIPLEQVKEELARRRNEWQKQHPDVR